MSGLNKGREQGIAKYMLLYFTFMILLALGLLIDNIISLMEEFNRGHLLRAAVAGVSLIVFTFILIKEYRSYKKKGA